MSESIAELANAASSVARAMGAVALRHAGASVATEAKPDGSPVTIADREAERSARAWIEAHFPGHGVVGEEFGAVRADARFVWYLDPIDGTRTFVRGVPLWGSLAAIAEDGRVVAGAADFPALGEHVAAGLGLGCRWNGAPCTVSAVASLDRATVLVTDAQFAGDPQRAAAWRVLADRAALARTWGDCYGYLLVATGRAEVMLDGRLASWDAAAVRIIVDEAGGRFTDWHGRTGLDVVDGVATNALLDGEVRAILANALESPMV